MKALLSKAPGGTDSLVLEDIESPKAGKGEVVIDVKAIGVNFPDTLIIQDLYQFKPERPFSPGGEVSGVVKEVGEGVTNLQVGQRVIGSCGRSEEHTSELQSRETISYAVFCLKKKNTTPSGNIQ